MFLPRLLLLPLAAASLSATLTVTEVEGPPTGPNVRIQQLERDEFGPTSFRFYASRQGPPTKTDDWVYRQHEGEANGTEAHYYFRDRDLGQTFLVGDEGFALSAITVRLQPVDVKKADPTGAKVSLQLMRVTGTPRFNANGTTATLAPNGTSSYADHAADFPQFADEFTPYSNAQWSTYATDWPHDPGDENTPKRWPIMHYSDDFIEGEHYEHLALFSGGVVPADLTTNDYLRWEIAPEARPVLEPHTRYAILFLFDEPAPPGVNRNIPLSNRNVVPGGALTDPYPDGHAIRRDGASTRREDVFIRDLNDPTDVAASRDAASFPADVAARLAIPPGTLGYPDVDTYRDFYFIIEGDPLL
ncbi:hypothetical protein [Actomonas aquatica]|uniref:Uncharacterized protein n=1 Tax=Actomonas aquatica TaxID=2866162 RepID=A0ABZ1C7S3_9BACT|nr:hypothetical protein [Opitutus sp. WL0086]WRQ87685.1 hypothetical protein K1X11_022975 [Opitutus sp. WL0086]